MGLPSTLPAKNGFGNYMSPEMQRRYPGIQFSQFMGAEMLVKKYGLTRAQLDQFSLLSHQRAMAATKAGLFQQEIVPIEIEMPDGTKQMHVMDEGIRPDATLEGISSVKLLQEGGALTAASASQICDGASGVMVVSERGLKTLGVQPLARVHHMSLMGHDPVIMLEAPLPATMRALKKAGMTIDDIDLFEVNEAFAAVVLKWLRDTGADWGKTNVNGGAMALGHPIGATGSMLIGTVLDELERRDLTTGLVTMCTGGGMGTATIIERI